MKKYVSLLLTVCLILCLVMTVSADENRSNISNSEEIISVEYFSDGSYLVRTRKQSQSANTMSLKGAVYEKIGSDDFNYYFSDHSLQWTYTIIGTYTIETGVSSVCTASTYQFTPHKSGWSLTNAANSYSGNTAYGSGTAVKKVLFITTHTYSFSASLSCDAYGNFS